MYQTEKALELEYLEKVLELIRRQIAKGKELFQGTKDELLTVLKGYWENRQSDFWGEAQLVETVARQRSLSANSYRRMAILEKMQISPYFGRIDFTENSAERQNEEHVYIGTGALTDTETHKIFIYDWRSPIAGMFYDFERGRAEYQSPLGVITGVITLKRQYKIVDGRMEYMFDCDLKIDDEILQQILSQSADEKMRTIVSSIQREQNQIIRDVAHRFLLVRGPAGSGKTSIALHRAAYLLYEERNTLTAKNILIFSPNSIFSDYISNVLPELGEENVLQTTFRDYIKNSFPHSPLVIEDGNDQLEYLYAPKDETETLAFQVRVSSIGYKSSPEFAEIIHAYLVFLEKSWTRDFSGIELYDWKIFMKDEWETLFFKDLAYLPIAKRLAHIKRLINVRVRPLVRELRRRKELEIAATGEEVNEKTIKALARLEIRKDLHPFFVKLDSLTEVNPIVLYQRLFEYESLFLQLAAHKLPKDWGQICAATLDCFSKGFVPYEDSIPLLYLQGKLEGFNTKHNIRHLIIDEAQDYTILQYEILISLFSKASWTILGDPAQSIRPYFKVPKFEEVAEVLKNENERARVSKPENSLVLGLTRSYRSTRQIQAFSRALLCETETAEHINRPGPLPKVMAPGSLDLTAEKMIRIFRELKEEGARSIAVICKTARESAMVYESLMNNSGLTDKELLLVTGEDAEFQVGTVVIPIYLAKGLEFDAVIVYDVSFKNYGQEEERKILYIACTRALHRLILLYNGEPSPFIRDINKELYQQC